MKIGLVDVDSKMPNLALMKISAWHKQNGDNVEFYQSLFSKVNKIYTSKIFSYTNDFGYFPFDIEIIKGGSGYNFDKLSNEIEHIMPDYNLYSDMDYSLGFTTRGCIRKCKFCIVPHKEGKIQYNADIYEFWNPKHKKIMLLDNNIFALLGHFERISEQILKKNLKVDFNQGLDIQLLTNEKAKILKKLKCIDNKVWRFSFDNIKIENIFRKNIEILLKYINPKRIMIFILMGFDNTFEEDLKKYYIVYHEYGLVPYIMVYRDFNNINYKPNKVYIKLKNKLNFVITMNPHKIYMDRKMSFDNFVKLIKKIII